MSCPLQHYETYYWITAGVSMLSIACCIVVIYSYCRFKHSVSQQYRLVCYLQVTDLIYSISNLFFPQCLDMPTYYNLCKFQAFLNNTTYYSSTLFTALISQILYCSIVQKRSRALLYDKKHWALYLTIGYGVPIAIGCIPFATSSYGIADYWCFFPYSDVYDPHYTGGKLMPMVYTLLQYIIVWVIIIHNFTVFCALFRYVKKTRQTAVYRSLKVLFLIPLVLTLSWIQPTLNRIFINVHQKRAQFGLALSMQICNQLLGLVNFVIYGLNTTVRRRLIESCCPCCASRRDRDSVYRALTNGHSSLSDISANSPS